MMTVLDGLEQLPPAASKLCSEVEARANDLWVRDFWGVEMQVPPSTARLFLLLCVILLTVFPQKPLCVRNTLRKCSLGNHVSWLRTLSDASVVSRDIFEAEATVRVTSCSLFTSFIPRVE